MKPAYPSPARRLLRRLALGSCIALAGVGPADAQTGNAITAEIVPITRDGDFFSDPFWVVTNISATGVRIAGTDQQYITCNPTLSKFCASRSNDMSIDLGKLSDPNSIAAKLDAKGLKSNFAGRHPFKNAAGNWIMAVTLHVFDKDAQDNDPDGTVGVGNSWSVITSAQPAAGEDARGATPPLKWVAINSFLVGNLTSQDKANYDGKFFQDDDTNKTLYLIYQKRLNGNVETGGRNGIVAQRMNSFQSTDGSAPVTLLKPGDGSDAKNSELYVEGRPDDLRLVETGNITKMFGKYVMAYAVGGFKTPAYKIGLAYSDTLIPTNDTGLYRKIAKVDTNGVWGIRNNTEVQYLLQSQKAGWPNYAHNQVLAPGVPTIANLGPGGSYVLLFAGYGTSDPENNLDGARRRPYYVRVNVQGMKDNVTNGSKSVFVVGQDVLAKFITIDQ